MKFVEDKHTGQYQLSHYGDDGFTVNKEKFKQSLIISADDLITDWQPQSISDLTANHWHLVIEQQPHILIIGVGKSMDFIHPEVLAPLYTANIGVEVMNTESACRTLNVLLTENRHVIAALFP